MKSKLLGDQSLGRDIVVSFQSLTTSDSSPSFVAHCSGSAVPLIKAKPAQCRCGHWYAYGKPSADTAALA